MRPRPTGTGAPPGPPSPSPRPARSFFKTRAGKPTARTKERAEMTQTIRTTARHPSSDRTADPDITAPDELECLKERTLDRLAQCHGELARDWAHCGKAACARSRRCRGFACEPDGDDA